MFSMILKSILLVVFLLGILMSSAFGSDCLSYESTSVKLYRQLRHQMVISSKDFTNQRQQYWVIYLSEAICIKDGEELINEAESNVRQLQLVLLPDQ